MSILARSIDERSLSSAAFEAFGGRLVGLDGGAVGLGGGLRLLVLITGNDAFFGELRITAGIGFQSFGLRFVPVHVRFGLLQIRVVASQRGFGLAEGLDVGALVDLKQKIAFLDIGAFYEGYLLQRTGDLGLNLNDTGRFHGAHDVDFIGHTLFFRRGYADGNGRSGRDSLGLLGLAAGQ